MNPADEVEHILQRLAEANPTGFAIGLHVSFTTSKLLFQTYRKDWMEEYSRRGFIMRDPTVRWGLENTGAIRWSDLVALDEDGVLDAAKDYGLVYGVTIAIEDGGTRSIGSFGTQAREFLDAEIDDFKASIERMHGLTKDDVIDPPMEEKLRRLAITSTHS